jgi:outer membrane cobalamin receptor
MAKLFKFITPTMKRYFLAFTLATSVLSATSAIAEPIKKLSELPAPTQSAQGLQGADPPSSQEVSPTAPESEKVPKNSSDEDIPLFEPRVKSKQTGPSQTSPSYSIPKGEIKKKGAQNLGQTLRGAPGFAINDVGRGADIHTGSYYRGRSLNDSVILLNGRPISNKINTYHGNTDLNALPVESVENVELSSGASSTLYGAEGAFSGIINVIPKEGVGPAQLNAKVEFGSLGQSDYRASYGGSDDKVSYLVSFQDSTSENNYPVPVGSTNRDPATGRFFNSGTSLTSYSANVSLELDQRNTLSFDATKIVSRKGLLYTFNSNLDTLNSDRLDHDGWNVGLSWKSLLTENGDSTLTTTLGYNQDYFNTYGPNSRNPFSRTGTLDTKQLTARVEHQLLTSNTNTLRYGVDLQNNQLIGTVTGTAPGTNLPNSSSPTQDRSVLNTSLFLLDTWNISRDLTLELGGRGSFDSQFGNYFNPSAGLRWAMSPSVTMRASWAGAQRNPGLDQLYVFDTVHGWNPNANLRPETGSSWNAGVDVQFSPDVTGQFTYYGSSITNRLNVPSGSDQWQNVGGVEVGGFESALKWQMAPQWNTFLNYTYTDARILSGQDKGLQDSLIPYSVAQAGIGYQHEGWQVNLIANHSSGSRRAFFFRQQAGEKNTDFSAPFVTLDLTGRVPLSRTTAVNVYLENLGGASFERVNRIYTPPGIVYRVGMETTF